MVEKRIIKNINNSIPSSNNYKNIETKLDFNGFQTGNIPKTRKSLKLIIPISAICTALVVAAIVVPVTLSKQNEQTILNPISSEMMSFYLKNTSFNGSGDIPPETSVGGLYNTYKQRPEVMAELAQRKEIFNLKAENKIHCYYVTKEVHEAIEQQLFVEPDDFMLPWRGLTTYCYGYNYGSWSNDLKNAQLMEVVIDASTNQIDTNINDYYLLDIVRYYNDSSIENFTFVGFVSYSADDNKVLINLNDSKDSYKYCSCTFTNPNKLSKKQRLYNYSYLCLLDFHSFEITQEGGVEVVKELFGFDSRHADINNDLTYYDDINECIIRKELSSSSGSHYGYSYDVYDTVFDYKKLAKLFNFLD